MKQYILYIGILFSFSSCARNSHPVRSGDLIFQAGQGSEISGAITAATGKEGTPDFTHVGIIVGVDSVLEASSKGVRVVALREFLDGSAQKDGRPVAIVMRLRDTTGIAAALVRARTHLGKPYDYSYLPGNGKIYCSELVWESYLSLEGRPLFEARPMNFRAPDGTMPRFWEELFGKLGEPVPEGIPGTNPNEMAGAPILTEIYRWY